MRIFIIVLWNTYYLFMFKDLIGASNLLEILMVIIRVKRRYNIVNIIEREGPIEYRFIIAEVGFIKFLFLDQMFCSLFLSKIIRIVNELIIDIDKGVGNVTFSFEARLVI